MQARDAGKHPTIRCTDISPTMKIYPAPDDSEGVQKH